MRRVLGLSSLVVVFSLPLISCTGGKSEPEPKRVADFPVGGTLRLAMSGDFVQNLDPHKEYVSTAAWELYRCCLLRTLLSYRGKPTEEGGTQLVPDLAAAMPEISGDGMTWTFRLKAGLRYAPPMEDYEIVAEDIIRGLERAADPVGSPSSSYHFYYSVIDGFDAARVGEVDTISGLSAPDDHTLVVRLVQPTGDLGHRLSLPAAAPIPPHPLDPDARLGVATGHGGDYGRYLVASGPYMLEGSEDLDFTKRPLLQPGAAGFRSGTGVTLVRNPSWSAASDPLRPAFVGRIEITNNLYRPNSVRIASDVEDGRIDMVFDENPPPDQLERYDASQDLQGRVYRNLGNRVRFLSFNTALPPFNDPNLRRAVALAIDKSNVLDAMRTSDPPYWQGQLATHLVMDSLEGALLEGDDLLPGGVDAAKDEMSKSPYDHDEDGRCDDPRCRDVTWAEYLPFEALFPQFVRGEPAEADLPEIESVVREGLARIGIILTREPSEAPFAQVPAPTDKVALVFGYAVPQPAADYPNATALFASLFNSGRITERLGFLTPNVNHSLLGASPEQLHEWGYPVDEVPNEDNRIELCAASMGVEQVRCWAALDRYLTTEVVPIVPLAADVVVRIVSERVVHYSFDQFTAMPALDQIAVAPGSD